MKTILAILFFAVTVSAQDNNTVNHGTLVARGHVMAPSRITFSNDSSFTEVQVGNEIYRNKIGVYQTMVIAIIIQQWTSYQKECTAEYRFEKLKRDSVWLPPYPKQWKKWLVAFPTFEGFMEYLKTKLAREK